MKFDKYILKPHPVKAFHLTAEAAKQIDETKGEQLLPSPIRVGRQPTVEFLDVRTATGFVRANIGDFIVQEPDGTLGVLTQAQFGAKYIGGSRAAIRELLCCVEPLEAIEIDEDERAIVIKARKKKQKKQPK